MSVDTQLFDAHDHHMNTAERAIQTFEDHPIACFATIGPDFPTQL